MGPFHQTASPGVSGTTSPDGDGNHCGPLCSPDCTRHDGSRLSRNLFPGGDDAGLSPDDPAAVVKFSLYQDCGLPLELFDANSPCGFKLCTDGLCADLALHAADVVKFNAFVDAGFPADLFDASSACGLPSCQDRRCEGPHVHHAAAAGSAGNGGSPSGSDGGLSAGGSPPAGNPCFTNSDHLETVNWARCPHHCACPCS